MYIQSTSYEQTFTIGAEFGKRMAGGGIVLFYGGLGAGKTAFCKGMAHGLGYKGIVTSPTFTIVNVYNCPNVVFAHFDMYRVDSELDLHATSFFDYVDEGAVVAAEWGENVEKYIKEPYTLIDIKICGENCRDITITEVP